MIRPATSWIPGWMLAPSATSEGSMTLCVARVAAAGTGGDLLQACQERPGAHWRADAAVDMASSASRYQARGGGIVPRAVVFA